MSKDTEQSMILFDVKRGRVSGNGNPGWVFVTDRGELALQTDSSFGYSVENHFRSGRWFVESGRYPSGAPMGEWHDFPCRVTFMLKASGRVAYMVGEPTAVEG